MFIGLKHDNIINHPAAAPSQHFVHSLLAVDRLLHLRYRAAGFGAAAAAVKGLGSSRSWGDLKEKTWWWGCWCWCWCWWWWRWWCYDDDDGWWWWWWWWCWCWWWWWWCWWWWWWWMVAPTVVSRFLLCRFFLCYCNYGHEHKWRLIWTMVLDISWNMMMVSGENMSRSIMFIPVNEWATLKTRVSPWCPKSSTSGKSHLPHTEHEEKQQQKNHEDRQRSQTGPERSSHGDRGDSRAWDENQAKRAKKEGFSP